jgi:hypothetical protein
MTKQSNTERQRFTDKPQSEQRRQKNTHAPCDNEKVSTTAISFPFIIPMTPPQTKQPAMDWRISALHITIPAPELLILT